MYHHTKPTEASMEDCSEAVGKRAVLQLEGTIVEARAGPAGPFVMFQPDERFGFGAKFGADLELLDLGT